MDFQEVVLIYSLLAKKKGGKYNSFSASQRKCNLIYRLFYKSARIWLMCPLEFFIQSIGHQTQKPLLYNLLDLLPPHVPPAAGTASVWTFAPPQASSHLLPFTSSQALHCLETKFRLFSSTMTTHETFSLHSSLTFVCLPAPYAPAELESPTSATTPTGLAIHVSVF